MEGCIFCPSSRKTCRGCGASVCAKHASAANGCCEPCLKAVEQFAADGRITTQEEDEAIEAVGGERAALYGEITALGFRSLAARLQLASSDSFVDLGSGLGRVVFQAVREHGVARSVGVEMAGSRHELAEAALASENADIADRVALVAADCSDPALWRAPDALLRGITVIYMGSLMFSPELMTRLAQLIESSPSVRAVATLKRFTDDRPPGGFRECSDAEKCETSWTAPTSVGSAHGAGNAPDPGCPVFIYTRARSSACSQPHTMSLAGSISSRRLQHSQQRSKVWSSINLSGERAGETTIS